MIDVLINGVYSITEETHNNDVRQFLKFALCSVEGSTQRVTEITE